MHTVRFMSVPILKVAVSVGRRTVRFDMRDIRQHEFAFEDAEYRSWSARRKSIRTRIAAGATVVLCAATALTQPNPLDSAVTVLVVCLFTSASGLSYAANSDTEERFIAARMHAQAARDRKSRIGVYVVRDENWDRFVQSLK